MIGKWLFTMLRNDVAVTRFAAKASLPHKLGSFDAVQKWFSGGLVLETYSDNEKPWIASLYPATEADLIGNVMHILEKEAFHGWWLPEVAIKGLHFPHTHTAQPQYSQIRQSRASYPTLAFQGLSSQHEFLKMPRFLRRSGKCSIKVGEKAMSLRE